MADLSITEEIADFYGAYYDPVADKFLETNDHGVLGDEDDAANAALRGARIARKHLAPQPVVTLERVAEALSDVLPYGEARVAARTLLTAGVFHDTPQPVVDREVLTKDAVLAEIDATQRELTDIMNVDSPLRDRVRREQGMDGIQRAVHKVIALRQRLADLPAEPAPQPVNQAELADVLREAFTADPEGATWQQAAEAVADWINGDAS